MCQNLKYPFEKHRLLMPILLWILVFPSILSAQFYNGMHMNFGKNRIQHQDFNWMYYRSDRCDVYFYPKGKKIAQYVLKYGSKEIEEMEQKIGNALEQKIQFVIYTNYKDFKESNIGLMGENLYNTGGVNYISGNKVFLYFDKGYRDLDKMMQGGIASIIISEMLYGGSVFSQVKNQTMLSVPFWFSEGLLSFYTDYWSFDLDDEYRKLILNNRAADITKLKGHDAVVAGHAFWKFVADKYSDRTVAGVVNMTRNIRNYDKAILYTLGTTFYILYKASLEHYKQKYVIDLERDLPENQKAIKTKKQTDYTQFAVANTHRHIAYVTNREGQERVWLKLENKKRARKIYKFHHRIEENPDFSYPLLAWYPRGEMLGMIYREKEQMYYVTYDVGTKERLKRPITNIDKVTSFAYSNDGRYFTFSGIKNGQSDIYVYLLASNSYIQITDDLYDDYAPAFYEGSSKIIFSSNRHRDSVEIKDNPNRENLKSNYDLFVYDFENRNNVLYRVSQNALSNQTHAIETEKNTFVFLSDESGIQNRYLGSFDSTISHIDTTIHYRKFTNISPLTNYRSSLLEHSYKRSDKMFFETFNLGETYTISPKPFSLQTDFENVPPTKFRIELGAIQELKTQKQDSLVVSSHKKRKRLATVLLKDAYKTHPDYIAETGRQSLFSVGYDTLRSKNEEDAGLVPNQVERSYQVQYNISQIVTQLDFSFLNTQYQQFAGGVSPIYQNAGFNALMMVGTHDLFEDYRIIGGMRFSIDFTDTEFLLSYEDLKHRLDKQVTFYRQNSKYYYDYFVTKQTSHTLAYMLKWPFSEVSAVRGTVLGRQDRMIILATDMLTLQQPNYYAYWGGLKGEYIFDNTKESATNILRGTRSKIFAEYYQSVDTEQKNLFVVGADYRHYTSIYKSFIWANRIAASTSFGKNRLIYYMGGVDNWLFPKFNQETNIAENQNYTYQTLATNMRGFTQNIRNGNSFAVINSELRLPVFQVFRSRPIKSSFLTNFQVIAFGDIGTAWTGSNPYSDDNSLFKQVITRGPITVTLQKQTDPIVGGYGFGLRSKLFGYFVRADWAWGVEDRAVQKGVFYFSLNLDF
ncbi:MAG: hypothetical protein RBS19_08430 [Bacteroidales bacterium]|nr:hypothetical protein [Bacteroidales bacterium]